MYIHVHVCAMFNYNIITMNFTLLPEALWVPLFTRASSLTGDIHGSHSNALKTLCTSLWLAIQHIYVHTSLVIPYSSTFYL